MNVALTGASGFIGRHLTPKLSAEGYDIRALGRRRVGEASFVPWDASREPPADALEGCGAVIHLAGETVAQRWTAKSKQRMRQSRIGGARHLVSALAKLAQKPAVILSASAVGFYGSQADTILTESASRGEGFLAELVEEWEAATRAAEAFGVRVVHLRFGIVLGRDGGAFPKMALPFRFGAGGKLGSGKQWTPWIHVEDATNLVVFALRNPGVRGAMNVTAPNPVTNSEFTRTLAHVLRRPALFTVPEFVLKLALGEMSEAVISSVRAIPAVAQSGGFQFQYAALEPALKDIA